MRGMDLLRLMLIWGLVQFGRCDGEEKFRDRMATLERKVEKLESDVLLLDLPRLSTLERKVEKLESEAIDRDDLIRLLEQGANGLRDEDSGKIDNSNGNSGTDRNSLGEKTAADERISPVTVLEVRRKSLSSKVKFTVKYRPDVKNFTIIWFDYGIERHAADYSDQSLSDGTRETSVLVTPVKRTDNIDLVLVESTDFHSIPARLEIAASVRFNSVKGEGMHVVLRNGNADAVQTDISLPALKVEPPGDLVYEAGKDVLVTMTTPLFSNEQHMGPAGRIVNFQAYVMNPDTGEVEINLDHLVEVLDNQTFPEHHEWNLKLKTSEYNTSGIILFSTSIGSQDESSLVQGVSLRKLIVLRPSTQDGPFPAGYLRFVKEPGTFYTDDGVAEEACSIESDTCRFTCSAVGEDITDIGVFKVEPHGIWQPASNIPRLDVVKAVESKYFQQVSVSLRMNTTTEDREQFGCEATSALGKVTYQEVVTIYYIPTSIVREESRIEILNANESVPSTVELRVVCRVKGRPRANVTFNMETYASAEYGLSPDEVIDEGNDQISAIKYLTYDPSDPYNINGHHEGKLSSAACTAETRYQYDYYNIPIPAELEK